MIKLHKGENETPSGETFYSYLSKVINPGRKKTRKEKKESKRHLNLN